MAKKFKSGMTLHSLINELKYVSNININNESLIIQEVCYNSKRLICNVVYSNIEFIGFRIEALSFINHNDELIDIPKYTKEIYKEIYENKFCLYRDREFKVIPKEYSNKIIKQLIFK